MICARSRCFSSGSSSSRLRLVNRDTETSSGACSSASTLFVASASAAVTTSPASRCYSRLRLHCRECFAMSGSCPDTRPRQ
ncbi:hypothetical protein PC116_g10917 [Phytophthora cactorum]|nr:hypothetical protein PC116_g10917 [Phytophthora cactorum]